MKKKLEADLISIAHRILKIRNTSDVVTLQREAQKLYETLSVLRFVEENFGEVKPTIGISQLTQQIEEVYNNSDKHRDEVVTDETEIVTSAEEILAAETSVDHLTPAENNEISEISEDNLNDIASNASDEESTEDLNGKNDSGEAITNNSETTPEEITADASNEEAVAETSDEAQQSTEEKVETAPIDDDSKSLFIPSFELAFDPKTDAEILKEEAATPQFTFDDLLGKDYSDPVFVKADEQVTPKVDEKPAATFNSSPSLQDAAFAKTAKSYSVNDKLSKGITIGLNDRIAFMKHLFGNSSEDYNRVLSQLLTFDSYEEADNFISDMVKPDYNNWEGKDEYSQRFMEIIERRFS